MAFKCCGGGGGFTGSAAKITLNGETLTVPYREVKDGDPASKGNNSNKKHIVWNLDNVDVEGHFPQEDFVIPGGGEGDARLDDLHRKLDPKTCGEFKDKDLAAIPKVVRVFRYWTGFETDNKEEYWKKREARVIEVRHKACWWYIVVDGVPMRCCQHSTTVPDKTLFPISFIVAEYEAEMPLLATLEKESRAHSGDDAEYKASGQLFGRRLNGMCKVRWSAKKEKWSYAVEVNGVPVPAMWSKPVPGIVKSDFLTYKEESGNCPKTAYVPDVLWEDKNLYTKNEIAQSNGEFMLVHNKVKSEQEKLKLNLEKKAAKKAKAKKAPIPGAGVGDDLELAVVPVVADVAGDYKTSQLYEYKTVRVWRFTLDKELRGVEVAHQAKRWFILVDGRQVAEVSHTKSVQDSYDKKGQMFGQDFKVPRNRNNMNRSNKEERDNQEVNASMKMNFDNKQFRWEYLLIVNDQFIPQCGWKGTDVNPRDFCAVEVPEVTVDEVIPAIADSGADGDEPRWKTHDWVEKTTSSRNRVSENLKQPLMIKKPLTNVKTSCVFNFTTNFILRTVAVLHSGYKFVITVDGMHVKELSHGSNPLSNMNCEGTLDIPDAEGLGQATIKMVWKYRIQMKWVYSLSFVGKNGEPFEIQPTFNAGWAACGKPVEVLAHCGLAALDDAGGNDHSGEAAKPKHTLLAETVHPEDTSIEKSTVTLTVTEDHGFKFGDRMIIQGSVLKEVVKVVNVSGLEDGSGEGWERIEVERCDKGCLVQWQVVHQDGVHLIAFEEADLHRTQGILFRTSSELEFHSGSVEMHQKSMKALKNLASFVRLMQPSEETGKPKPMKITGYTGAGADVFETANDLKFLGLRRALYIKKLLQEYLSDLGCPDEQIPDIGAEGQGHDMDTEHGRDQHIFGEKDKVFTCSIHMCSVDDIAELKRGELQVIEDTEAGLIPDHMEIVGDEDGNVFSNESGGEGGREHVWASLMTLTNPLQHFVFDANNLTGGPARPSHWGGGNDNGMDNGNPSSPKAASSAMVENKDLGVLNVPVTSTIHGHLHSQTLGYELHEDIEFFSKTHKRWVAASITNVLISGEDCFYNIVFASNRMKRQYVAMDSLRHPLQTDDNVEVYSKKSDLGWIIGKITQGGKGSTTVGYTVETDKGTFAKVPPERFRRRFIGGQDVQYYQGSANGWCDARIAGSQGMEDNNKSGLMIARSAGSDVIGPREVEWLSGERYESQFSPMGGKDGEGKAKFSNPNAAIESTLGDLVGKNPIPSAKSTTSAKSAESGVSGRSDSRGMAPVGETPLPSGAPLTGTPSPSDNVAEATSGVRVGDEVSFRGYKGCKVVEILQGGAVAVEVAEQPKLGKMTAAKGTWTLKQGTLVIEPWTSVPLYDGYADDGEDTEGKQPKMIELWKVRARPPQKFVPAAIADGVLDAADNAVLESAYEDKNAVEKSAANANPVIEEIAPDTIETNATNDVAADGEAANAANDEAADGEAANGEAANGE